MRVTLDWIPILLLVDLPLMAVGYNWGLFKVLLGLLGIFLLRTAIIGYGIHVRYEKKKSWIS